jgi:hypothetical protein
LQKFFNKNGTYLEFRDYNRQDCENVVCLGKMINENLQNTANNAIALPDIF